MNLDLFHPSTMASPPPAAMGVQELAGRFGVAKLDDSEALALFLARVGVKGADIMAKALIGRFGSYGATVAAGTATLVAEGCSERAAADLGLLHDAAMRLAAEPVRKRDVISSWTSLLAYLRAAMAHEPIEQFRVLYLDKKNQLIRDEIMAHGTVDHAPVYPREIAKRALLLDASSVIVAHNHPSGDPAPSSADIDMTRQIVEALKALRITVHDHVVIGRDGVASFKALGLI